MDMNQITVDAWFHSSSCSHTGKTLSDKSIMSQRGLYNSHVSPLCGNRPINNVTYNELANMLCEMHSSGYSFGAVFGTYSVLTKIFRSAYLAGVIDAYPCEGLHHLIAGWNTYNCRT